MYIYVCIYIYIYIYIYLYICRFNSSGGETDGIARLVSNSVLRCETEVQGNLLQNIVVAGGGSCTEGTYIYTSICICMYVHIYKLTNFHR
jgi:hypothetical protein